MILRAASEAGHWPPVEDVDAFLPTSAWQENQASLAGEIQEDLWNRLVMAYALLEFDRARFVTSNNLPPSTPLPAREAEGIKEASSNLGRLRRELGGGGGWLGEIHDELRPSLDSLNDSFTRWLDGLSDDYLKQDAVVAKATHMAKDLGELN